MAGSLILICNPNDNIGAFSEEQIKAIFEGELTRIKGTSGDMINVHPVILFRNHMPCKEIAEKIQNSPKKFMRLWRKKIFTGAAGPPKNFDATADLIKYVSENSGAIGYVAKEELATVDISVRILNSQ